MAAKFKEVKFEVGEDRGGWLIKRNGSIPLVPKLAQKYGRQSIIYIFHSNDGSQDCSHNF